MHRCEKKVLYIYELYVMSRMVCMLCEVNQMVKMIRGRCIDVIVVELIHNLSNVVVMREFKNLVYDLVKEYHYEILVEW